MSNTSFIVNENMWNNISIMWYTHDKTYCWSTEDCIFGVVAIILLILIIIFMFYYFE